MAYSNYREPVGPKLESSVKNFDIPVAACPNADSVPDFSDFRNEHPPQSVRAGVEGNPLEGRIPGGMVPAVPKRHRLVLISIRQDVAAIRVQARVAGAGYSRGQYFTAGAVVPGAEETQPIATGVQIHEDMIAVGAPVRVVPALAPLSPSRLVEEVFARDIELFGYEYGEPVSIQG
jgi:hypothetical protein